MKVERKLAGATRNGKCFRAENGKTALGVTNNRLQTASRTTATRVGQKRKRLWLQPHVSSRAGDREQVSRLSYTKSVSSRSCATGWKTRALRRIPSRQAVSSELANTRPAEEQGNGGGGVVTHTRCGGCAKQASGSSFTSFVTVLHGPGDPLDGFSRDFGAEVSVEGRRSSSLSGDGWVRFSFSTSAMTTNDVLCQIIPSPNAISTAFVVPE